MINLDLLNHFHDAIVISVTAKTISRLTNDHIIDSGDYVVLDLIVQINSLKNHPIVSLRLINCSKYQIDQTLSELVWSCEVKEMATGFEVQINNCYIHCSMIEVD